MDCFLYSWGLAVTAAPLLVFASSRFLVPALPVVALFQAYPVALLIGKWFGPAGVVNATE